MADNIEVPTASRHFTGSDYINFDPPAPIAGGLTGRHLQIGYRMGKLFNGFTDRALKEGRIDCPQSASCKLSNYLSRDDGGNVSSATYHCPRVADDPDCNERMYTAAATVIARADAADQAVMAVVEAQFAHPLEVTVMINQPVGETPATA